MNRPPVPINQEIRISWVVYEFATRQEAEAYAKWCASVGIELKGGAVTTGSPNFEGNKRHYVWARD